MIGRTLRIAALLMAGLGLVTACGSSDRPRELSMDDVKPCELVAPYDIHRLEIRAEPQPHDSVSGVGTEGRTCYYNPYNGSSVYVSTITNHGIDRWMDGTFEHSEFQEIPRIQGFRAIEVWQGDEHPGPDDRCEIYVDVADGQSLRVEAETSFEDEDPPTCDTARQFAEVAMESLPAEGTDH